MQIFSVDKTFSELDMKTEQKFKLFVFTLNGRFDKIYNYKKLKSSGHHNTPFKYIVGIL